MQSIFGRSQTFCRLDRRVSRREGLLELLLGDVTRQFCHPDRILAVGVEAAAVLGARMVQLKP